MRISTTKRRKKIVPVRIAGLAMLVLSTAGCIAIPRPYPAIDVTRIESEEIGFIQVGATRREDISSRLGPPDQEYDEGARWLYILTTNMDGGVQWCGGDVSACTDRKRDRTDTMLDIVFDGSGTVTSRRIISVENGNIDEGEAQ